MKDTERDLPRALHSSMTLVLLLFLAANTSYFVVLEPSVVASTNTVALDFGRVVIGRFGAILFSILVAISCFGALNASFYTSGLPKRDFESIKADHHASFPTHLCCCERSLPALHLCQAPPKAPDARSCYGATSRSHSLLHRLRRWLPK